MEYNPTIGLEIHIELITNSKMFCGCKNDPQETQPNLNICPVCLGHPGTLPLINKEAVRKVIKTAISLNCQIQREIFFERKNYFYPDLPKGYQISQYSAPLAKNGCLKIDLSQNNKKVPKSKKKIRIRRIHLEEDTAKLIHPENKNYSLVDFNRAGIPLMELVTEPDIESAKEAKEFIKELQLILRYLGVSGANMEKGEMRVEVNISLTQKSKSKNQKLGTKVEIKNLNSLKSLEKAIEYEVVRQSEILEKGEKVIQETRGWHDKKEITFSQREKEQSHDYRYFPEPDLPPLEIEEKFLVEIKKEIPEFPQEKRERFKKEYALSQKEIEVFVAQKELSEYFEKIMSELRNLLKEEREVKEISEEEFKKLSKLTSNYLLTDLQGLLISKGRSVIDSSFLIQPENFAEFITFIYNKKISSKIAKMVLKEMFESGADPSQIIKEKDWRLVTDEGELEKIIKKVISDNQKPIEDYQKGKTSALQFLIGQVMKESQGKAEPKLVEKILEKKLKGTSNQERGNVI